MSSFSFNGQSSSDFAPLIPPVTIHGLRHTNASLLIAAGTDIRTVANRLGHADMSTTMNIYTHAVRKADEAAAQAISLSLLRQA